MRSAFFGLHVTTSALNVARANLHTIAHNIANAETQGFSRQVALQQAHQPLRGSAGRGMVGTGAHITSVIQVRNQFLDQKFWSQHSVSGQYQTKFDIMTLVQGIMREGEGGAGISSSIDDMFARLRYLTTNAQDLTFRRNFMASIESLATTLNSTYSQLRQQKADLNQEISVTVGVVNSLGRQISALNRQITVLELDGSNANDLRDQRAVLIDELSRYVNIDVREIETNADFAAGRTTDPRKSQRQLVILIDGVQFVNHFDLNQIEVRQRTTSDGTGIARNPEEQGAMYDIWWSSGMPFRMYSPTLRGELAGLIHLRDGNGGNFANFGTAVPVPAPAPSPANPFPLGFVAATATTPATVTMEFNANSRVDLGPTGIISVLNANGSGRDLRYTDYILHFDEDPTSATFGMPTHATFVLYEGDNPANTDFAPVGTTVTDISVGRTTSYMGIPYFMARLNELTRTLAAAFNEGRYLDGNQIPGVTGHFNGYDLNGNLGGMFLSHSTPNDPWTNWNGVGVFNYFNITASNFRINPELLANPDRLAIANGPATGESNADLAHSWVLISTDRGMFREGRVGDFVSAMTGDLGITGRQAENFAMSYSELMMVIDNQRRAISGVSLDEEVAMMIQHQLVFQAAARLFTTIDNIYDTMINRMGNW
ncbi:MAG: flagellar hook-associated protein FlgK [Defluviitaleaceae bacterium]|nr:flagellar hook-associated protein FlgK [Defluviitaleaceae bacterium]